MEVFDMATCKHCGRWLGQAMTPTPAAGLPALSGTLVCQVCRWTKLRIAIEGATCVIIAIAAVICLYGQWQKTEPYKWIEPAIPAEPQHGFEELPHIPAGPTALVMSLDY